MLGGMSAAAARVVFRCGAAGHATALSRRDVGLLDGQHFLVGRGTYRELFGLDFVRGRGAPHIGQVLARHPRLALIDRLEGLLRALDDQRDLIGCSYGFRFSRNDFMSGVGAVSGFSVRGLAGAVSAEPSGYCDVVLTQKAPSGRSRVVEIIDLRVRDSVETEQWGTLTAVRRPAAVGWFEALPPLLAWLRAQRGPDVELVHPSSDPGA
jgi:hypothetical protein